MISAAGVVLLLWLLVAIPLALLIGRVIAHADREARETPQSPAPEGGSAQQ